LPIYEEVGKLVKKNEKLIIAKMDYTLNQVDNIKLNGFPTILFYSLKQIGKYNYYNDEITVEKLLTYLKKNT